MRMTRFAWRALASGASPNCSPIHLVASGDYAALTMGADASIRLEVETVDQFSARIFEFVLWKILTYRASGWPRSPRTSRRRPDREARPFVSALTHPRKLRTEAFRNPAFPASSDRRFHRFMDTSGSGVSGTEALPRHNTDFGRIMDEIGDNLQAFLACLGESLWITCGQHFEAGRRRGGDGSMMRRGVSRRAACKAYRAGSAREEAKAAIRHACRKSREFHSKYSRDFLAIRYDSRNSGMQMERDRIRFALFWTASAGRPLTCAKRVMERNGGGSSMGIAQRSWRGLRRRTS